MTGAGQTIGRYEIEAEIGRGSMGIVYRAYDPLLRRVIALKTILAPHGMAETALKAFEGRFFEEARAAARLTHHAIVIVHDLGRDEASGILFLALEYLHGQTLAQLIAGNRALDWREALRIAEPLAEGIHHASLLGVVHQDIKPANVMILPTGQPKIMDFGIAKIETARLKLAGSGESFGTPLYMSPEQALGKEVDHRV
jgi:eukaryotic-like serine/threonine-protein kinase